VIEDRNFFFQGSRGPLYGVLWEPRGGSRRCVVVCDSLFEEKFWCERVLANLSRRLAGDGTAVLSFDYRGYGNSPDDTDTVDVPGLERNIHDACELARSRGCSRITLLGVRWGAALAGRVAAAREDVDSLFLVQPVTSWRKTLMAALRGNVAGQYSIFKKAVMTREEIVSELLAGRDCVRAGYRMNNIEGYIFSRDFFGQSEAVSLPGPLRASPPAVVLFDIREGEGPEDPECAALAAAYRAAGVPCETVAVTGDNRFWLNHRIFTSTAPNFMREVGARVAALDGAGASTRPAASSANGSAAATGGTADGAPAGPAVASEIVHDGVRETAVRFACPTGEMLYGVCYSPEAAGPPVAAVLFTHGGLIGMNGAFRFNTRAARAFAREGIYSLCFDPHGMGRSPDVLENIDQRIMFRKIQTGIFADDVDRAAALLQERSGIDEVIVFGVCGGAITNIQAHARSRRVKYSMLLSIPVMLSGLSHEEIRMSEGYARFYLGMYARKIFNPRAWWRFITFQSEYSVIFKASRLSAAGAVRRLFKRKRRPAPPPQAKPAPPPAAAAPPADAETTSEAANAATARQAPERKPLSATSSVTGSGLIFNDRFLDAYRTIVARGERILFVFGENDNFRWEYESAFLDNYPDDIRAGEGIVETEIIPHANHMYTLQEWQREILRRVIPRLVRKPDAGRA
jgi:pimeloyl-ACP methyl ester carboxylesterase